MISLLHALFTIPALGFCAIVLCGLNIRAIWSLRKIPGPMGLPYVGHFTKGIPGFVHYKFLIEWPKQYGRIYKLFLGQHPYVVVTDPYLIEQIGTRKFDSFHDRVPLPIGFRVTKDDHEQFNSNIMWAKGRTWTSVRSAAEPLFHTASLKSYGLDMHESIGQWLTLIKKLSAGGAAVNIIDPMNGLAMSVLGKANFGVDFDRQSAEPGPLVKAAIANMDPPATSSFWNVVSIHLAMLLPSSKYWMPKLLMWGIFNSSEAAQFAELEGFMNGATKALINNAKADKAPGHKQSNMTLPSPSKDLPFYLYHQQKGQAAGFEEYKHMVPKRDSFIPRLLAAKIKGTGNESTHLTDQQICAQAYTMLLAGYDSPANSMSHTLYELAKNPLVQGKLISEVDKVLQGRHADSTDLPALIYTEAAFQEGLRIHHIGNPMYSPVRVCTKEVELGGYVIPKGTGVMLNTVGMTSDDQWFPRPEEYLPERHIPGTPDIGPETRPATCHIPFGFGPHRCVGRKFAIQEAVFLLSRFFQEYSVTLDEKNHPPGKPLWARTGITFQPASGIFLRMHPREAAKRP